jgi:hypothetical protein
LPSQIAKGPKLKTKNFKISSPKELLACLPKDSLRDKTALFVFGPTKLQSNPDFAKALLECEKRAHVVGCSTAGEIIQENVFDDSIAVAVLEFETTTLCIESVALSKAVDSFEAGKQLSAKFKKPGLKGILIFSDELNVNGSQLTQGLSSELPPDIVVTGGLAGDGSSFKNTWVIQSGVAKSQVVTGLGLYGKEVEILHGSKGGWDIFGPERTITKSKDNVVFEIDGQPALKLYKSYLGDRAPQGSLAQLMRANFERIIEGASHASTMMKVASAGFSLAISCVGRKLVLGSRIDEEVEAVLSELPKGTLQLGFYSYGEISPLTKGEPCQLQNQTMTLTYISEGPKKRAA